MPSPRPARDVGTPAVRLPRNICRSSRSGLDRCVITVVRNLRCGAVRQSIRNRATRIFREGTSRPGSADSTALAAGRGPASGFVQPLDGFAFNGQCELRQGLRHHRRGGRDHSFLRCEIHRRAALAENIAMKVSARGPGSKIEGKSHGLVACLLLLLLLAQVEGNPRISEQISKFFEVSTIFII